MSHREPEKGKFRNIDMEFKRKKTSSKARRANNKSLSKEEMNDFVKQMESGLGKREKADHEIVHFESPPKTRLRKKLEDEAEKIRKMKETRKKDVVGNQRRLDKRLADNNLKKYKELGERRKQKIQEEEEELKDLPEISPYELKKEYVHPEEREADSERKNFDQIIDKRRKERRERLKEYENLRECTFHPETSNRKYDKKRSIEDLFEWQREKTLKLNTKRISNLEREEEYTFKPEITRNSSKLALKANGSKSKITEDRLLKFGDEKNEKLKKQRSQQNSGLFKPYICENSRKIMNKKNSKEKIERIKKTPNGQFGNVKYFTASKATASTAQDTHIGREQSKEKRRKTMKRRARTKSKEDFKKGIATHSLDFSKDKRKFRKPTSNKRPLKSSKKGKKDPLPSYKSPFSKEVIQSEIPLKVLTKKENMKKIRESGKTSLKPGQKLLLSTKEKKRRSPRRKIDTGLDKIRAERKKKMEKRMREKQLSEKLKKKSKESRGEEKVFYDANGGNKMAMSEISKFSENNPESDFKQSEAKSQI